MVIGKDYAHYADPTVAPDHHQSQIYSALLFPSTEVTITQQESHVLGILNGYTGGCFHDFFGAAWSEFDVRSQDEWRLRVEGLMHSQRQPLQVKIQKQ